MTVTLYGQAADDMTLSEAITRCADALAADGAQVVGLLYAPERCTLARLGGRRFIGPDNSPVDAGAVYEARVFSPAAELRWLNAARGRGRAVLLSESPQPRALEKDLAPVHARECLEESYLLWGEGDGSAMGAGWSRLSTARIGTLVVPVDGVGGGQRVRLRTREYIAVVDEHGNVAVVDERLLQLEVSP